jgi:hypothetical protein
MRMSQDSNRSKVPQPKRIDELLKDYGFRPDAPVSTARALIVNLVRSAYGHEAAREFIRQMNLSENQDVKLPHKDQEFQKSIVPTVEKSVENSHQKLDFLAMPVQLRLFDDTGTD